ncbi:lysylphosphatidylglycerol synthase domain-containing protein [Methylocystis sp. WRRC1]|uniref:lysylphosphatidylglycerol synthase domain-containing protein n=1 Tax=unclassified Methylocystis TaxID=2625913 RepID=UPI0001F86C70|nr:MULTISPECIES: lysylphosphatidylglycerol synthase domain-containing protein [unclassified Methylocystis]MCC3245607.1 lysylphosphatidylglycerol synthase domain-containing protein [Methylocystis sp. WRRC1]
MQKDEDLAISPQPRLPVVVAPQRKSFFETLSQRLPHGAGQIIGALASLALFTLAAFVLGNVLSKIHFADVATALKETSGAQILVAMLFTALSYLALTGYDVSALYQIRMRSPYRIAALASFASYAISFNLGFPIITGAAVRYWIYSRVQITALQVANITVITGVTFWLGMTMMIGVSLLTGADALAALDHVPVFLHIALGVVVTASVAAYCVWVALERRRIHIRGHALELPRLGPTLAQLAFGVADLCAAAGALYVLLPQGVDLDFMGFVAVYVVACILGVVSHAPGGIGVFEAIMLHALPGASQGSILASLLLFRVIYYFLPFIFALAVLGADEGARRWSSLRDAIARILEDRGA